MGDHQHVEVQQSESERFEERHDVLVDRARAPRVEQQHALAEEREQVERSATDLRLDPMYAFDELHVVHSANWNSEAPPSTGKTDPVM